MEKTGTPIDYIRTIHMPAFVGERPSFVGQLPVLVYIYIHTGRPPELLLVALLHSPGLFLWLLQAREECAASNRIINSMPIFK